MPINRYLIQKEGETFYLMRQTAEIVDAGLGGLGDEVEWYSDWEKIYCSLNYDIVRGFYERMGIGFAGELIDLETFGEGTYGEGSYGPI